MLAGISKPLIFVVISVLAVTLIFNSISDVSSRITRSGETCNPVGDGRQFCCGTEKDDKGTRTPTDDTYKTYCEVCTDYGPDLRICDDYEGPQPPQPSGPAVLPEDGVLEQPPTPPPSGPAAPLQDGVLEQPPTQGVAPPVTRGQGVLPEDGVLQQQQPPADQGPAELPPATTEPAIVEEEQPVPVCQEGLEFNEDLGFCVPTECPEGQELNEVTGICVLEEQPAAAEEPEEQQQTEEEQPQPEGEQPSEESSSGDSGNN
jgi:hypothetical protein